MSVEQLVSGAVVDVSRRQGFYVDGWGLVDC